jgi:NADH-quinone oxidoreductase subunit G
MTHSLHINKLNFFDIESFIKIYINDYAFHFEDNYTLLQACLLNDIYLPRFCYHSKLSIVGNCRLCYIEEIKTNKPLVSCATPVVNDLEIFTETRLVTKARHGLLELLLINHPLDCPVCDQGSECDLQDQFFVFGNEDSRYFENKKRNVIDKNISPLIKLSLNRCIHCARCTRFTQEIGGLYSFSLLGRGVFTEISNYLSFFFKFELSGNIIDLCPVGALTAKSYSFSLRY